MVEKAEGMRSEEEAVQTGHLAAQLPGEFQDPQGHREHQEGRDQGHHLAL